MALSIYWQKNFRRNEGAISPWGDHWGIIVLCCQHRSSLTTIECSQFVIMFFEIETSTDIFPEYFVYSSISS